MLFKYFLSVAQLAIALVIRTQRPFFRSRPGKLLLVTTLLIGPLAFVIPFLPFSKVMGFTPIPLGLIVAIVAIVGLYVMATELTKLFFYRRFR